MVALRIARAVLAALAIVAGAASAMAAEGELTGTLKKVNDTGVVTLGYRESSLPFSYLAGKQPVGYSIDLCHEVADELGRAVGAPVTAGAASPVGTVTGLRASHEAAARAHRLLLALGRDGDGATLSELGIIGDVLEAAAPEHVQRVVDRALGPLLAYDAEHQTALFPTVELYFACGQSPPETARSLEVHVNTVYQRLERVDRVLGGTSWREPHGALEMQMALQLHRACGSSATTEPPAAR